MGIMLQSSLMGFRLLQPHLVLLLPRLLMKKVVIIMGYSFILKLCIRKMVQIFWPALLLAFVVVLAVGRWRPIVAGPLRLIRAQVGDARVICGLSGGVDSSVAAVLIHQAIGDQLTCVFVDHGLLRKGEAEEVISLFSGHYNIPLIHIDASDMFLGALMGSVIPKKNARSSGQALLKCLTR